MLTSFLMRVCDFLTRVKQSLFETQQYAQIVERQAYDVVLGCCLL